MHVKRLNSDDVKVADTAQVKLKTTGNTAVAQFTAGVTKSVLYKIYQKILTC